MQTLWVCVCLVISVSGFLTLMVYSAKKNRGRLAAVGEIIMLFGIALLMIAPRNHGPGVLYLSRDSSGRDHVTATAPHWWYRAYVHQVHGVDNRLTISDSRGHQWSVACRINVRVTNVLLLARRASVAGNLDDFVEQTIIPRLVAHTRSSSGDFVEAANPIARRTSFERQLRVALDPMLESYGMRVDKLESLTLE